MIIAHKNGHNFMVMPTHPEFWQLFNANCWEVPTFSILDTFLNEESNYLDIGAWIGPTVLYASKIAKQCYAIEPDPYASFLLQANLSLNHCDNVKVFFNAIGDKNDLVKFYTCLSWLLNYLLLIKYSKTFECRYIS